MQRVATTVIGLVGEQALGRAPNIRVEPPDYYLVLDSDAWGATRRHWFLGLLHRAAPNRVVPDRL